MLETLAFTPYTLEELCMLFADNSLSANSLRLIHVAKKRGGTITGVECIRHSPYWYNHIPKTYVIGSKKNPIISF